MSDDLDEAVVPDRLEAMPLTPQQVRATTFGRTPLGRRGFNEDEVVEFLDRVAEDLARRDRSEAHTRANAERHKNALRAWSVEHAQSRGLGWAPDPRPPGPRLEAINLMSQTQQSCDRYIRETQTYCRRLAEQAEQHANQIIDEARHHAARAAERAAHEYRAEAGAAYTPEGEELQHRLVWMRTFIDSLGSLESQLSAARDALEHDLRRLSPTPARR
jgi:DivIVA domain-containing protein